MRKLVVFMNISLDGYVDHTVAVAADDELHQFAADFLKNVDLMLFGRTTYQLMEGYWPDAAHDPKATKGEINFADKINSLPKIVFSQTIKEVEWNNARLGRGDIVGEVIRLKKESGKSISVGGISIFRELMKRGLIDEFWFLIQPVIVGEGKRLVEGVGNEIDLKLIETKTFNSGVVVNHYSVKHRK